MEVYLVGGALRDERLGFPVRERDWCVVGSSPDELASLGYKPVGKEFPVFLHPETNEEYALARTEKKTGSGYHGFSFHTSPDVTIEADLQRRDLTINAMARATDGAIIDPYGGISDIEAKQLRHVSDAFAEDPVRILRVARFAARYAALGFTVADETMTLMRSMVDNGEVDTLVPDRVWQETNKALLEKQPRVFFESLRECGALEKLYPEVDKLFGIPQPKKWHPEVDCGVHTMMVLEQAATLSEDGDVRFAALVHDLGKAVSDKRFLPIHHGHEKRSVTIILRMADRLPIPSAYRELALLVAEYHAHCHRALELKPTTILRVLKQTDAIRRPQRFEKFVTACEADARGRTGFEKRDYPQAEFMLAARQCAADVVARDHADHSKSGDEIRLAIEKARLAALKTFKATHPPPKES